ncbi:tyrosine-type recombinase/integrase [Caviibacterium pharyngocola]|uniref:Site-specific integrase n=1 Tax=Caviibacterium pharyngocola TaxID=28159 RepID=A0A2M8RUQ1_9PAST|nr:site-specific integrase [Caviibacterium pharyngocola]PJG82595.1 site-specific integrase [Caviibacterium pharyngocola]
MILNWRKKIVDTTIKPITWNSYNRHLKAIFSFAIKHNLISIEQNPFDGLFIKQGKNKKKTLTKNQLNKISYILDKNSILPEILEPRWFIIALIMTLRYTAMRRSQLLKLRIYNVNLDNRTIFIEPSINKNHDFHIIPISEKLYPHLERLIFELKKHKQSDKEQLFNFNLFSHAIKRRGFEMNQEQLTHIFKVLSKCVGFTVSPHRFRHTAATLLMKDPNNVYVAQKLLGHKDIKTTLGYIEHNVDMIREYVDML